MDLYQQSDVSAFEYAFWVCHNFPSKEQVSFNFMTAVIVYSDFGAQENKSVTASTFFHSLCHEMMGPDALILVFLMLRFMPTFSVSSFILIKRFFSFSSLVPLEWYYLHI